MTATQVDQEIWYQIEFSLAGENDWALQSDQTYDTEASAQKRLALMMKGGWEYRVIRVTVTKEALA